MEYAIDETQRRREKQMEFNKKHGITPKTVIRKIHDLKDGFDANSEAGSRLKVAEKSANYNIETPKQLAQLIAKLEKSMFEHAKNMEFEEGAKIRDEIARIKSSQFVGG